MRVQCQGCGMIGNEETWEADIRANHPSALTCCPDRDLRPINASRVWIVTYGPEDVDCVFSSKASAEAYVSVQNVADYYQIKEVEVQD